MKPSKLPSLITLSILVAILALLTGRHSVAQAQEVEPIRGMIGVGTWNTRAEFKDIKVLRDGRTLFASDFSHGLRDWQSIRGQWSVSDGVLRQNSDEEDTRVLVGDPSWSNYSLTLKVRKLSGKEGFLILFGVPDTGSKNWWNLGGWGNTRNAFQGPGIESDSVPGSIETGRWYDVKVELKANRIQAYLDGRLIQAAVQSPRVHTVEFSTSAPGQKLSLRRWGLDTAWAEPNNMRRGLLYMGQDRVNVVRVSFPVNQPLVNGDLPASKDEHFLTRLALAKMAGDKPFTMLPDTEAGINPWYKNGREIIPERWVQLIAASQKRYGKTMESIEPFNEADYGWGQGSAHNLNDIMRALRARPEFAGVDLSGPSTLSSGSAQTWYDATKTWLQRATTHSLGGSFSGYIQFYQSAGADGKVLENPEVHNLVEVISGAEYGLRQGIWWGTAELARGEFVSAVQGERLAYAEDRPRWTAAGVYRAPSGKIQAFVGSSERMGETTTYRFVSRDRPVFFNGDGPRRDFSVTAQRNDECLVNITWGQDVPPKTEGRFVIVNRQSGKVLGVAGASKEDGADLRQMDYAGAENQQWDVAPFVRQGGDQSYFNVHSVHSGKSLDTARWNHDEGGRIQQWGTGDAATQQWYFEYAGDSYFYIRSRWSTKCLGAAGESRADGAAIQQFARKNDPTLQWRLVPVSGLSHSKLDSFAPKTPSGLRAISTANGIRLDWNPNPDPDLAGYTIYRSPTAKGPYDIIARGVTGTTLTDSDPEKGRSCFYKVTASDTSLNQSPFSKPVIATTR